MRKTAFTLAETLIVLSIIGIIAALTLPTVISNYHKKVYVASLQRTYNMIANAAVKKMADSRVDSLAETDMTTSNGIQNFLTTYFKVTHDCGVSESDSSDCMASSYLNFSKSDSYTPALTNKYCVLLNTGVSVCMDEMGDDNEGAHGYSNVIVDINGKKSPNVLGRDLFGFEFYSDGKVSEGYNMLTHVHYCGGDIDDSGYAAGCFSKIMSEGWKMDY